MGLVLEIVALGLISLLIVHYLRGRDAVSYKKYLAVSDSTPVPKANCGEFDEPGTGRDEPLSLDNLDWEKVGTSKGKMFIGVPDEVLAEDTEVVEKYFPVIAEGDSMRGCGIYHEDVAWVKKGESIDPSAYALGDRVLIMSRSQDELKIRKLIEKLDEDRWKTSGCSRESRKAEHAQKRFQGKVVSVTHRQRHCASVH